MRPAHQHPCQNTGVLCDPSIRSRPTLHLPGPLRPLVPLQLWGPHSRSLGGSIRVGTPVVRASFLTPGDSWRHTGFCTAGQPLVSHPRCRGHVPCWSGHWGSLFCARPVPGKPVRMSWPPGGRNRPSDTSLTGLGAGQAPRPCSCGLEALRPIHGPTGARPLTLVSTVCAAHPQAGACLPQGEVSGLHPHFPRAGATLRRIRVLPL